MTTHSATPKLLLCMLIAIVLPCAGALYAQTAAPAALSADADAAPQAGGHEMQVWLGGADGIAFAHSVTPEQIVNLGGRFGWMLTGPAGPKWIRGTFEYAVDVVPVYTIFQRDANGKREAVYGAGFDPFALKWNFLTRHRLVPYIELSGGTLFTGPDVPARVNNVNFVSTLAFGTHFLRGRHAWSLDVRLMHVSDAYLTPYNPGINMVQFRLGFGIFTHARHQK